MNHSPKPRLRTYYDRPAVLSALEQLETSDPSKRQRTLTLIDVATPQAEGMAISLWQVGVIDALLSGSLADLTAFSPLVVLDERRGSDLSSAMLSFAEAQIIKMANAPKVIGAFQVVLNARGTVLRFNRGIRGTFVFVQWPGRDGPRGDLLWELPLEERESSSHITVICGTVGSDRGFLVLWDLQPSLLRAPDKRIAELIENALPPGAFGRLEQARKDSLGPAIRSHLYEEIRAGTHPVTQASKVVDALQRYRRQGLHGLHAKLAPLDPELPDPRADLEAVEIKLDYEKLRHTMKELPARQQEILELHGKGMKWAEIARTLGVSRAAVSQAVSRARALLRDRLSS